MFTFSSLVSTCCFSGDYKENTKATKVAFISEKIDGFERLYSRQSIISKQIATFKVYTSLIKFCVKLFSFFFENVTKKKEFYALYNRFTSLRADIKCEYRKWPLDTPFFSFVGKNLSLF